MNAVATKPKFDARIALHVAKELCDLLKPVCAKLVVAGSLRRRRSQVGDVEILYIGITEKVPDPLDMFAFVTANRADDVIADMEHNGILQRRLSVVGAENYGPKNKLMLHSVTGIPVDLFQTTEANWWVSLVVRTGSKETNLRLTTGAQKMGRSLNAYGCGVTESDGTVIPATSEQHVFELCGVPYLEPWNR